MAGHMAIITACAREAALVRRRLRVQRQTTCAAGVLWQGTLHGQEVVLLQCGMGSARAASAVRWLAQHYALTGVLSVGFAGALQADLARGDALLVTSVGVPGDAPEAANSSAGAALQPDARLAHVAAMAVAQAAVVSYTGALLSTPTVLVPAAKRAMGRLSGALAVDMESYSIAQVALQHHLPFGVLRTIFDTVDEQVAGPLIGCMTPAGSVPPWRVLGCLARHPALLRHLPHWWWTSQVAGRHMQRWLQHFFLILSHGA